MKGKAKRAGHSETGKEESAIPVISLDYAYMKERDGHHAEEEEQGIPILVMKDCRSRWMSLNVVVRKGVEEFVVSRLIQDMRQLGYRKLIVDFILKSKVRPCRRKRPTRSK